MNALHGPINDIHSLSALYQVTKTPLSFAHITGLKLRFPKYIHSLYSTELHANAQMSFSLFLQAFDHLQKVLQKVPHEVVTRKVLPSSMYHLIQSSRMDAY